MNIWCISDTHMTHEKIIIPYEKNIDMVIHSGDASNYQQKNMNLKELNNFFAWYSKLNIKYKIYVPGNHDTSIEANLVTIPDNIIVLKHEYIEIEGIKIFGSPYTPSFGYGWSFNKSRHKIDTYWQDIPSNIDILITHGPPKGILDYTSSISNTYEQCGCSSLLKHIINKKPRYHIFGHIHEERNVLNCGTFKSSVIDTVFINASIVDLSGTLINNGTIININKE